MKPNDSVCPSKKLLPEGLTRQMRTCKLNGAMRSVKPSICIERAQLVTQSYRETEGMPAVLRRAYSLKYLLEHMTLRIEEDELIVGNHASKPRSAPLFPEFGTLSQKELDLMPVRKVDTLQISEADKEALLGEVYPYWENKNTGDISRYYIDKKVLDVLDSPYRVFNPLSRTRSGYGHYLPDVKGIIEKGFKQDAPLSILGVWEEEFRKFAAFDYSLIVLEGTGARKADTIRHMTGTALQVLVVNYESAWRLEKELAKWQPDMIVCDEGHKIKTHNIAASKALHRLGARAKYRLLLTGTVITNKPIDVFSQYKFADPKVYGSSFYLFRNRYFDMVGYGNHTPVMKRSMEAEFTRRLHSIAYRATKAECLDLPEFTDIVQRVELEPAARRVYRQLVKDSYVHLQNVQALLNPCDNAPRLNSRTLFYLPNYAVNWAKSQYTRR